MIPHAQRSLHRCWLCGQYQPRRPRADVFQGSTPVGLVCGTHTLAEVLADEGIVNDTLKLHIAFVRDT